VGDGSRGTLSKSWKSTDVLRVCYNKRVDRTVTIRIDRAQDEALTRRAKALGRTRSQLVRELIDKGLEEQPLGRQTGHLRGHLTLAAPTSGLRRRIRERNWR
jgi:Ribbon-helix-helix protein, copG family